MSKEGYLIGKLNGQIEGWESEINNLRCEIDDTSDENVKTDCENKIDQLQAKIVEAKEKINSMSKSDRSDIPPHRL
ncbi:MAG: hypothetical protein U5N58_14245 [Actinomycetota bacterium]|nr:hypothetical protein [Actinomycetota bacterium]